MPAIIAAILAALGTAKQVLDNPLIKRLLLNLSKNINTPVVCGSQIDDWVIRVIYDIPAPDGPTTLEEVQERVDTMPAQELVAAKAFVELPPDILALAGNG